MKKSKARKNLSFFYKSLLLLLPIYFLWYVFVGFCPDCYNLPTNTRWQFINEVLLKKQEIPDAKLLFLGESRVNAGINFTAFPHSFSFASGGATSVEMYFVLKKYLENHQIPEQVFLSISPRFFTETFSFFPFAVRNNLFTSTDFTEITSNYAKNKKDTVLGNFPTFKFYAYKLRFPGYYQTDVYRNKAIMGWQKNKQMKKFMLSKQGKRFHPGLKNGCSNLNYETRYQKFKPSPLLDLYFNKLLLLCKQKNIHLIFDFMPMNKASFDKLKPEFVVTYKNYIKGYALKFPTFQISDTLYYYRNSFFGDASHLNATGEIKFTNYLEDKYLFSLP